MYLNKTRRQTIVESPIGPMLCMTGSKTQNVSVMMLTEDEKAKTIHEWLSEKNECFTYDPDHDISRILRIHPKA